MIVAPHPLQEAATQHARDLRVTSLYADVCDWIEHAADNSPGTSPEAEIAATALTALHELKLQLEPQIERLAIQIARREAADLALDLNGLSGRDLVDAFSAATDEQIAATLGANLMETF
jgi:hypothetical protein